MDFEGPPIREGMMKKKGQRVNMWGERFFSLRVLRSEGPCLLYYVKQGTGSDSALLLEPKGYFKLERSCKVTEIRADTSRKKPLYVFRIVWPIEGEEWDENALNKKGDNSKQKPVKKKDKERANSGDEKVSATGAASSSKMAVTVGGVMVGAMTTGIGVLGGMLLAGAATAGGEKGGQHGSDRKEKHLTLACDKVNDAEKWVAAIQGEIVKLGGSNALVGTDYWSGDSGPPLEMRLEQIEDWIRSNRWRVQRLMHGIRVFEQDKGEPQDSFELSDKTKSTGTQCGSSAPCLRINLAVNAPPTHVFNTIMSVPPACRTGTIKSFGLVETLSSNVDIVHMVLDPVYISPTWTAPRDLCLVRYWKSNPDGSYVICLDSTTHSECPLLPGHVRGDLHAAYLISSPKFIPTADGDQEEATECLLSCIAQYNPRGWVWQFAGYRHELTEMFLMHVIDFRDAIDADRFVQVRFDAALERNIGRSVEGALVTSGSSAPQGSIGTFPAPTCPTSMWADVDPSSFRIRGRTYNSDKMKEPSAPSIFKLICVDMFETNEPVKNIAADPRNRVSLAQQRGESTWVFVVSFMVPGPPHLNFVAYMEGNKEAIESDTPFGRIARPFFFGNDDEFRNNRFKLIPKVVEGNMVVKMAVKDTPTLIGNKLKQYYFKGDNYFELDIDVTSSSVARNLTALAIGYSKALVVDMGFCLQGNDENELPEVLMGGVSCVHLDTSVAPRLTS